MRVSRHLTVSASAVFLFAFTAASGWAQPPQPSGPPSAATGWKMTTIAEGLVRPWGMDWLPDGRLLITAKNGTLHVWDGKKMGRIDTEGMPAVFSGGQGALMEVSVHPKPAGDPQIYLTMSTGNEKENRTILVRGTLEKDRLTSIQTLFQVEPAKSGGQHFGSRLLWLPDGTLLMTIGDGGNPPTRIGDMLAREQAQNTGSHLGSVLRLTEDGKPAPGNPLAGKEGARAEIWTYGHRNIQGIARDADSGRIWATEHGPFGGDELNLLEAGGNYGWPLVTMGRDYRTKEEIGKERMEGMKDPRVVWTPAHPPSGLAFFTGDSFPNWRGSLFSGGLASQDVRRIILDKDGRVTGQERLEIGERVRDVRQGPDGYLYVLTDVKNGRLLRIEPE
jgi:aldose sugar dehydrogenase